MRNVIGLFVLMAMFSCSETGQRHGVEVLESWENGVVKKDRVNLAADTFIVNIHTARPGIIIGKRGEEIENLKKAVEKIVKGPSQINIKEVIYILKY